MRGPAGETLAEAAAKLKLKVVTVDAIDQSGQKPDGTIVNDLPESSELLRAAFDTEVGVENPAINLGSNGYLFFEVQGVTPARDRPLEEVKGQGGRRLDSGRGAEAAFRQGRGT